MKLNKGKVYLVGAGCGAKDLITLRGLNLIRSCDAIIYDDLIDESLIYEAPENSSKIYMGKRLGKHSALQNEINQTLIKLALDGKNVVRLKGGDPFVFGRGGEEAMALNSAGIEWEIIPGISSAIAIPAFAGIPVTHRGVSRSFHVITGHTAGSKDNLPEDISRLASLHGTLVFLMGLSNIEKICESLILSGKDPNTPAAVISGGNSPHPAAIRGTLSNIANLTNENFVCSPAIIVIGETAGMDLLSNSSSPLKGIRIGLTGTDSVTFKLKSKFEALGANVNIVLRSIPKPLPLTFDLDSLFDKNVHWLVFTSANGVRVFFQKLRTLHIDMRRLYNCKFAVIGAPTGKALEKFGILPDLCPNVYTSENLAEALISNVKQNEDVILLRASNASDLLPNILLNAGISVQNESLYEIVPDNSCVNVDLDNFDYLCFSSAGGVNLYFDKFKEIPLNAKCVCIGDITAKALIENNINNFLVSSHATCESVVDAILQDNLNNQEVIQ